jgi:RNA polymerase sigma-70 factor, ECF subfamily
MDRFAFDDLYVRRLKEHDPEVEAHFDQYFRGVLLAKLYTRLPAQDIEDAIQDVLWRALTRLDELRESCKLGAFVLGICKYVLLERYGKKESRTEPLEERHLRIRGQLDIEEEFLRKEAIETVRQILSEMRDSREVKILRAVFLDDQDRAEVAGKFHLSAENFRVVLHRAIQKFKAALRRKSH